MSSNDKSSSKPVHSAPIPIATRNRGRSVSISSASSGSASSSSDLPTTPASPTASSQRNIPSPSTSPILSYFLTQSPSKTGAANTFPFKRKFGTNPVFEVDEEAEKEIPVATHARRASATVANRFSQNPTASFSEAHTERGTNVLRRLSLSSASFVKPPFDSAAQEVSPPSPPPNTAVTPTLKTATPFTNKPRRAATISADSGKPRRAPSPMGERILKGHFDGFN